MGSEWRLEEIGQYADVYSGFAFKSKDLGNEGVPVVKIKNVNNRVVDLADTQFFPKKLVEEKHSKYFLKNGDVLIAMTGQGSVGRVGRLRLQANQKVLLNQRVGRFVAKDNLDLGYFYYVVSSSYYEDILFSAGTGSGQPNLSPDVIRKIEIPIFPLPEQKAIAHVLGALDDRIELNRRMNETLEAMAQALFKSWFVDFDPVIDNALASGKEIPAELSERAAVRAALGDKRQPLPAEIRALFPNEFTDSDELGWIPKEWEVKTINDAVDTVGGGTPSTKNPSFWEDGVHAFCTPKDMSNMTSKILTHTGRLLTDKGVTKISSGQLPERTVLMSSRAPIGYLAISDLPVSVNQGIIAMKTCSKYEEMFLVCWVQANMERIKERANGSTFLEISKKNFRLTPFLVPNADLVKSFNRTMQPVLSRIISCTRNSQEISTLRDTLLPKLLSGEVRIPDAEKMVEELAL